MATTEAGKEALWIAQFLAALGYRLPSQPVRQKTDNRGAILLTANSEFDRRTKHIEVRHYWIWEKIESKQISIAYISIENMVADGLTQALDPKPFKAFRKMIRMWAATGSLSGSVGSEAILCLYTELVLFHVSFVPTSHLFRL